MMREKPHQPRRVGTGVGMTHAVSAVLLAGGYGTRLYPLTKDCPKALLPIGERVVLDWIVENVSTVSELSRMVLVTNHRFAGQFEAWRASRQMAQNGVDLQLIDDGSSSPDTRLGAIRDLLLGMAEFGHEDVLVLGTDNMFAWPLAHFATFAATKRSAATVAVQSVSSLEEARRYAVVELDAAARLTHCVEKPAQPTSLTIALCVYYFPSSIRARLEEFLQSGGNRDAPGYFLEWLVPREPVYGFRADGQWFDIGDQETYEHAVQYWLSRAPSGTRHADRQGRHW